MTPVFLPSSRAISHRARGAILNWLAAYFCKRICRNFVGSPGVSLHLPPYRGGIPSLVPIMERVFSRRTIGR
jgi:hypothetical protein